MTHDHPVYGPQRSFYNILRDFQTEMGAAAQPLLHMTSFVIASPGARRELDARCLAPLGLRGMTDGWWAAAAQSDACSALRTIAGTIIIPRSVGCVKLSSAAGDFGADRHLCRVPERNTAGGDVYPCQGSNPPGPACWPTRGARPARICVRPICPPTKPPTGCGPRSGRTRATVSASSPRWALPRFVCGSGDYGWTTPEGLACRILDGVTAACLKTTA